LTLPGNGERRKHPRIMVAADSACWPADLLREEFAMPVVS
jgi:hypothetical protein